MAAPRADSRRYFFDRDSNVVEANIKGKSSFCSKNSRIALPDQEGHPYSVFKQFKTMFGGQPVDLVPTLDFVFPA